jgi:hypothetical protein
VRLEYDGIWRKKAMRRFMPGTFCVLAFIVAAVPLTLLVARARDGVRTAHLTGSYSIGQEPGIARHLSSAQHEHHAKGRRPTPDAIWKGIKSAAQDAVRSNSPLIKAPEFDIKQIGSTRQLTIVKGDVSELGFEDDPYELPFKEQILIEALRQSLAKIDLAGTGASVAKEGTSGRAQGSSEGESYWQPYLVRAESLDKKVVVDIESDTDKNSLSEKLRENQKQIDEILYDEIYKAVEQDAQRNGYNIIYGRGGPDRKMFSVNISTVPDGAKVWMMTGLVYRQHSSIVGTDPSRWPWKEMVQNPLDLLGGYHYRARWPDGKQAEGDIEVLSASPVTFKPD